MNTNAQSGVVSNDIQVCGIKIFPEERWREAILYYLFGIWTNREDVMYSPKISFGPITLRLDTDVRGYFAYGKPREKLPHPFPFRKEEKLAARFEQTAVESSLVRFVKNDRIKILTIVLPGSAQLVLWKKEKRGQYGVTARGILPYLETLSEAIKPGR